MNVNLSDEPEGNAILRSPVTTVNFPTGTVAGSSPASCRKEHPFGEREEKRRR
jgi:hypothetical protein